MDPAFLPEKAPDCTVNLPKTRDDTTYYYTRRFRSTFDVTVYKDKEVYISDLSFSSGMYTSFLFVLIV